MPHIVTLHMKTEKYPLTCRFAQCRDHGMTAENSIMAGDCTPIVK